MVHFLGISILLVPIVTALGDDFWDDVDKKYKELSDLGDLSRPANTNETQQVGLPSESTHTNNEIESGNSKRKTTIHKHTSFFTNEMIPFNQAVTIDPQYPKNLSETEIRGKLLALGDFHEWPHLRMYNNDTYSKYWALVCTFFSDLKLTGILRVGCRLTITIGTVHKRKTFYEGTTQSYDLLGCQCQGYQVNYYIPATPKEKILIHQSSVNEFFVFEHRRICGYYRLYIKNFKGGITLPNPIMN